MDPLSLFVYGSLRPGGVNEGMLSGLEGTWRTASVRGRLVARGWGSALGYPAIVLDEEADPVRGFVLTSKDLAGFWGVLDRFEGEAYRRVLTSVRLEDGSETPAFMYVLRDG